MKTITTKAIILGHREFGEYDKVIHFYSADLGKIQVVAKGSRKITSKFTGHLETLNICQISLYFGPRTTILTEINTIENHQNIRENFEKLTHALQIVEITNQMVYENQENEGLIELLEESISAINHSEKSYLIAIFFIVKLLDMLGYMPDLQQTATSLEEKYHRFLSYIQSEKIIAVKKISLTAEEKIFINSLIKELVERETNKKINCLQVQNHQLV